MATVPIGQVLETRTGSLLVECVAANGSAAHPYLTSADLLSGADSARNLADAIHILCAVHGRHPSMVELVAMRSLDPDARQWLAESSETFARDRSFLARLAVEAGPTPSTPGGGSEAAIGTQRNSLATLAQSERRGCAIGAAFAFMLDWAAIRAPLQVAGEKFGVPLSALAPIDTAALDATCERVCKSIALRRAVMFGAEQVALQHRGLWDLLWARALARRAHPA